MAVALSTLGGSAVAQAEAQASSSAAESLPLASRTIDTADGDRTYHTFAPAGSAASAGSGSGPSLVLALHPNGGDGVAMAEITQLHELARREGFVIAFPDGMARTWNYVRGISGYPDTPDDVAFLIAVASSVEAEFRTDPRRRYVMGYSNGGFMAQRLACDAADTFAGFVSVAAAGFVGLDHVCPAEPGASVALVHGTADTNVPWDGLPVSSGGRSVYLTWPVSDTFAFWGARAGCTPPATRTTRQADSVLGVREIVVLALEDCAAGRRVALFALIGGSHAWPRGSMFDAGAEAWRFLEPQTLP